MLLELLFKHKQVPAIETVLKAMDSKSGHRGVDPIFVLVLCPTRELASQVAAEANALLRFHDGIGAQTLVGGTRFKDERQRLESGPSQVFSYILFLEPNWCNHKIYCQIKVYFFIYLFIGKWSTSC